MKFVLGADAFGEKPVNPSKKAVEEMFTAFVSELHGQGEVTTAQMRLWARLGSGIRV